LKRVAEWKKEAREPSIRREIAFDSGGRRRF
jgi:hypothetical protein